jgi:Fe-Mn family superoxide dismutase
MHYTPKNYSFPAIQGISAETLALHVGLYNGYVTNVNILHDQLNALAHLGDAHVYAVAELRRRLGFEWNGMRLHEIYFDALVGGAKPLMGRHALYAALAKQYGSYSEWLSVFSKVSARGPGWALLCYDAVQDTFLHVWIADHDIGALATLSVILAVDYWEHAYLKEYAPAERQKYVDAYLSALNWETVAGRFELEKQRGGEA